MKKTYPKLFPNTYVFSIIFIVLIITEILFYQFYYSVPITLNGKKIQAKRDETLENFLKRKKLFPQKSKLVDIEGQTIAGKEGYPPIVFANDKRTNMLYPIESDDNIEVKKGKDKVEEVVEKVEEVQSKIVYKGRGSFIYIIKRGRPGVRMVKKGQVSNKIMHSKWKITPQDFTIGRTNIRYRNAVALTFDDGPSKYTSLIMKILRKNKAKGSFFVVGSQIKKKPLLLKQMKKYGFTIGNHTYNHSSLEKLSSEKIKEELNKTDGEIFKETHEKTKWVRPPWGELNSSAINFILKEGYRISLWNIDTKDWARKNPSTIKENIIENLKPGQVILLHDGGGNRMNTAKALPEIIKGIKEAGYRMVSLDDLYRLVE